MSSVLQASHARTHTHAFILHTQAIQLKQRTPLAPAAVSPQESQLHMSQFSPIRPAAEQ